MKITKHAYKRFSERTNFTASQRNHNAKTAFRSGYRISDFDDPLYSYLFEKQPDGDRASIRVWGENIYVFDNRHKKLVTVYPVPKEFLPIKNFLCTKPVQCVIRVNDSWYVSEDGETPTVFRSKQKANNYIKNNRGLDFENAVVIPIDNE